MHFKKFSLAAWLALVILAASAVRSQQSVPPVPGSPGFGADQSRPLPGQRADPEDEARARAEKEMAKRANQERQAQLKRDTERLLKLANELQQYVDKSNENVLSVDVVKKAEEIEKLAHNVKQKMKGP